MGGSGLMQPQPLCEWMLALLVMDPGLCMDELKIAYIRIK